MDFVYTGRVDHPLRFVLSSLRDYIEPKNVKLFMFCLQFSQPTWLRIRYDHFGFKPINVKLFTFIYGSHIIPGIPPPIGGISGVFSSGISDIVASVVSNNEATEVAF